MGEVHRGWGGDTNYRYQILNVKMPPTSSTAGLPSKFKLLLSLVLLLPLGAVSQSADPTSLITGADAIAPSLVLTAIMSDGQRTVMSGDIVPTESPRPGGDEKPDTTPSPWTGEDEAADSTPPPQPSPSPGEDEKPSTTLPPQFTRDPGQDEKPDATPSPQSSRSSGQNEKPNVTLLPPPPPGQDLKPVTKPSPQPPPSSGEDEKPSTTLPPQFTRDPGQDEEPDATPSPQSSRSSGQNEKPNVTLLPPPPPGQDLKPDTKPSPQPTPSSRGDEGRPMASDGQGSSAPQSTAAEPYQEGAPGLDRTTPTPPVVAPPQPSSPSGRNTAGPAVTNAATPYSPAKTQAPQVQTPGAPSQAPGVSGTESGPSASRANTQ
jgi:hypothetical protein